MAWHGDVIRYKKEEEEEEEEATKTRKFHFPTITQKTEKRDMEWIVR